MRKPYSSSSFFFLLYCIIVAASTLFCFAVGCPARDSASTDTCPVAQFDIDNSSNSLEYMYYYRAAASSIASRASIPVSRSSIFRHTMSSSSSPSSSKPDESQQQQQQENKPSSTEKLALPEFPSADSSAAAQKLDVGGGGGQGSTVSLDHLGPIVVNTDGSMSRISNWEQMTEMEKKNTLRIVGKRNQQRLQALREAGVEGST